MPPRLQERGFTCKLKVNRKLQGLPHAKEEHYMESILYVGMDVHTTNYTLCTYSIERDKEFALAQFKPDHLYIVRYIKRLKEQEKETGDGSL